MASYSDARLRQVNDRPVAESAKFVLYWMQAYRRLDHNHALDHALSWAAALKKPLVVYEGLKLDYPWASARLHRFILEGMIDNQRRAAELGLNYWPFVETPEQPGRGLLRRLSESACLIVTDDFPAFIHPRQIQSLAQKSAVHVTAVDSNSVVPLSILGAPVSAAAHLRPRIHKAFAEAWEHRAAASPKIPRAANVRVDAPFDLWKTNSIDKFVADLPIDQLVKPVTGTTGGTSFSRELLSQFLNHRLPGYAEKRSRPVPPEDGHASELSAHLHFGHISIEEIVAAALGDWNCSELNVANRGKRDGYYHGNPDVNSFLDEAITWRDVGFHWHSHRHSDIASLATALPPWAMATLAKHEPDPREFTYTLDDFEAATTHDPLWNAAQTELVVTGRIQNYMRMLWGKKVIEWSVSPNDAYKTLEHLNNKYALDGRDPNSYTGILWCFGLFDRPWAPERKVLGVLRYMSSTNTAKKFKIEDYLAYVDGLRHPARSRTLFDG